MCFAPQRRALFRDLNFQKLSEPPVFLTCWLPNVFRTTTACIFSTSQFPKVVRAGVFCTFWLGNVLRATTACTFSTSQLPKVIRKLVCFVHFDFKMCFAPQRRALFRHRHVLKWSEAGVFCAFWLENIFRATMACTFSTSPRPKVLRPWCVFYILTWKCASRHNGVQFFISHLASWLRTRRVSEPTFRPSGATNHWKNSVSRLSYLFAHLHFFSDFFSDDVLSSNFSLLSASALLCFSSVHTVGSLTSKFPSIIITFITFFTFITFITVITVVIIIIINCGYTVAMRRGMGCIKLNGFRRRFFQNETNVGVSWGYCSLINFLAWGCCACRIGCLGLVVCELLAQCTVLLLQRGHVFFNRCF